MTSAHMIFPVSTIAQMGQQAATAVACGHHNYGQDPGTLSSIAFQVLHQTQPGPVQSTAKGNESRVHHILTQSLKCANPVLHGLSTFLCENPDGRAPVAAGAAAGWPKRPSGKVEGACYGTESTQVQLYKQLRCMI